MAKKDALSELGFAPVVVKARRVRNTNTVTLTRYNAEKHIVTFKFGEQAAAHFGETVDVYVNNTTHQIAFRRTQGAQNDATAIINKGQITVANLTLDAKYLGKATYTPEWDDSDQFGIITLTVATAGETSVEAEKEYAAAY